MMKQGSFNRIMVLLITISTPVFSGCINELNGSVNSSQSTSANLTSLEPISAYKMNPEDLLPKNLTQFNMVDLEKGRKITAGENLEEANALFIPTSNAHSNLEAVLIRSVSYTYEGNLTISLNSISNSGSFIGGKSPAEDAIDKETKEIADNIQEKLSTYYKDEESNLSNLPSYIREIILTSQVSGCASRSSVPIRTSDHNIIYDYKQGIAIATINMRAYFIRIGVFYSGNLEDVENEIENTMVCFDKAIQERLKSSGLSQNEIRIQPDSIEKQITMPNISSSNASPLKSGKLPIMATAYKIKLGPYNITYSLEDIASYGIKKSGPSRMIQSEGPSFDLYSFDISNDQSLGRINVEIRKFTPNMDRKTRHIEKMITDTLSSWGYEDITMSRRLFGGHRSGALGVGRAGEYDTIFLAGYWNSDHSYVTIIGTLPEPVMNGFFESIRIEER